MPKDFPNWKAVSMFYYRTQKKGIWEEILKMLVKKNRKNASRNEEPSYALIDSQSVKTTSASENRGYDGGKIHDTKGGVFTFEKALYKYPSIIAACADQGYCGTFKNTFETFHNIRIDISPM